MKILCLLLAMTVEARPWTAKQVDELHLRHVCWLVGQPSGERAVVTGANWEGLDMIQGWFERAVLVHVNFNHATLWNCNFNDCDLRGADFSRANLGRSTFMNADLRGANFTGADLFCIELAGAKLDGANFKNAKHWPSRWHPVGPTEMGLEEAYPDTTPTTTTPYESPQAAGLP